MSRGPLNIAFSIIPGPRKIYCSPLTDNPGFPGPPWPQWTSLRCSGPPWGLSKTVVFFKVKLFDWAQDIDKEHSLLRDCENHFKRNFNSFWQEFLQDAPSTLRNAFKIALEDCLFSRFPKSFPWQNSLPPRPDVGKPFTGLRAEGPIKMSRKRFNAI